MSFGSLISSLHVLVEQSENVFLNFARSYHNLFRELELSISSSSVDASYESNEREAGSLIQENRLLLQENQDRFYAIHGQDDSLFGDIDESVGYILSLKEEINRIKDDSEDMWLMALNAMTAGIKAGKAGGAFPVITGEFKNISLSTMNEMRNIIACGNAIEEKLRAFKALVEETRTEQQQFIEKFGTRMFESAEAFNRDLQDRISLFSSLVEQSKSIHAPLRDIMEEIQQQDIIRQSIDQVVVAVSAVEEYIPDREEIEDAQCDAIAFRKTICDLCESLLDDVAGTIRGNRDLFKDRSTKIRTLIIAVEEGRERFQRGDSRQDSSAHDPFLTINELVADIELLLKTKDQIHIRSGSLMKEVRHIEEMFERFGKLVNRYTNINLLYRIEVEKQPALHNMKENVYEIVSLTDKMQLKIDRMRAAAKSFIKITENIVRAYEKICSSEEDFLNDFKQSIRSGLTQLNRLKENLRTSVNSFTVFTQGFFELFDQTKKDAETLQDLIVHINTIKESMHREFLSAGHQLDLILDREGLSDWSVTNGKMQDVISRFTIFRHKKKAAEIAAFDVEDGSETGVLTLF